jgi:undecaprenyl-diphosphatase
VRALNSGELLRMAAVLGFAALVLTIWVSIHEAPLPGDIRIAREIQSWRRLDDNQAWINGAHPWRIPLLVLAAGLVLFRWRLGGTRGPTGRARSEALWAFGAAAILSALDNILKAIVRSPRPIADFGIQIQELKDSYGFPSGHVYGNVLVYGVLAATAPAWVHPRLVLPLRAVCIAIIVLSGPARVVVGAHWPSDTLGGYLWGGAALTLALALAQRMAGSGR